MKSRKGFTLVEIMIVVVIIAMLAVMAVPGWQKIRQRSQNETISNNLRQLSAAAQQYFLESGNASVGYGDLVGSDASHYIKNMQTAAGEDYSTLNISSADTAISVAKVDGDTVTFQQ